MKTRGHYNFARLLKKEGVRGLLAAALFAAPLAVAVLSRAADWYPGNGSAMSAESQAYYLPSSEMLSQCGVIKTVKQAGGADYISIQAAVVSLGASISTNTCIAVLDTATYGEVNVPVLANNGYRLKIMKDPSLTGASPSVSPGPTFAGFAILGDSVTVQGINVIMPVSNNGFQIYGDLNEVLQSTITLNNGSFSGLYFSGASSNTVSEVYVSNLAGDALTMLAGSNVNIISSATLRADGTQQSVAYIENSSSNTIGWSFLHNPSSFGPHFKGGGFNTVRFSTITGNGNTDAAVMFDADSGNMNGIEDCSVLNTAGTAVHMYSNGFVRRSALLSGSGAGYAVYFNGANNQVSDSFIKNSVGTAAYFNGGTNTITRSTVTSSGGDAIRLAYGMSSNTISYSTITAAAAGAYALYGDGSGSNLITRNFIQNPAGAAVYLTNYGNGNSISFSTITSAAAGYAALSLNQSANSRVASVYARGGAAFVLGDNSDGSTMGDSTFFSTDASSAGVKLGGSSGVVTLSSSVITGGANAAGVSLVGTFGSITLSSNTVLGGAFGAVFPSASLTVTMNDMTFQELSPGATAINFLGGSWTATFNNIAFNSANILANVNAGALASGGINMTNAKGRRRGPVYEYDPASRVAWTPAPILPPGCPSGFNVAKDGSGESETIWQAVNALSKSLTVNTCVVIRDTQTYSEQVTVKNFTPNNFRLTVMADPTFISSAPAINPPVASTAAFQIASASVTIAGINVVSTNTVSYGIYSTSSSINISSVNVAGGSAINGAGVYLFDRSSVYKSSISVQDAHGLWLSGSYNSVLRSTMTSAALIKFGLYLYMSSSNTISESYMHSSGGNGAGLLTACFGNSVTLSTMTSSSGGGGGGLYVLSSSSNTFANSYIGNPIMGHGAQFTYAHSNTIRQSTVTGSSGYYGVYFSNSSSNTVTGTRVQNNAGTALQFYSSSNLNRVVQSNITSSAGTAHAVYIENSSSNTIGDNYISNSGGNAVYVWSGAVANNIVRSTITSGAFGVGKYGVYFNSVSSNTLMDCFVQGSTAVYINASTNTAVGGSVILSTWPWGVGLSAARDLKLTVSSSTLGGGLQGAGLYLAPGGLGAIVLSSNTLVDGSYGLNIAAQGAGAALNISSITFAALSPGATAINFLAGQFISTITGLGFYDPNIAVNINGSLLNAGSRITVHNSSGTREGAAFENDPNNYVEWDDFVPPTVKILAPADGSILNSLTALSGTASDNTKVSVVQFYIKDESIPQYWTGGAWSGGLTWLNCSVYPSSWSYNSFPALSNGINYTIVARAQDLAGNWSAVYSTNTFTGDTISPSAVITSPFGLPDTRGNLKSLSQIYGTTYDQYGVKSASISVMEADTLLYYDVNTTTFDSVTQTWFGATASGGPPAYTWTATAPALQDNKNYELQSTAVDFAGNVMTPVAGVTIRYDTTLPVSMVTAPKNGSVINSLASISGTAQDPNSNPSGPAGAQIKIQRVSDNKHWDGAAWMTGETWLDAAGTSSWSKTTQLPPADNSPAGLQDGLTYTVSARAYDVAGNTQTVITGNSFAIDFSSPTAAITQPLHGSRHNTLNLVTGTANDSFSVDYPKVRIYDAGLDKYWKEDNNVAVTVPVVNGSAVSGTLSATINGTRYLDALEAEGVCTSASVTIDAAVSGAYTGSATMAGTLSGFDDYANGTVSGSFSGTPTGSVALAGAVTCAATTSGPASDGFETGGLMHLNWVKQGNVNWYAQITSYFTGSYAAQAGAITDNQYSALSVGLNIISAGNVAFRYSVSSESGFDYLRFYIDGVQQGSWSGVVNWTLATYPVTAGIHNFRWVYSKDGATGSGSDTAWLDEITFPANSQISGAASAATVNDLSVSGAVASGNFLSGAISTNVVSGPLTCYAGPSVCTPGSYRWVASSPADDTVSGTVSGTLSGTAVRDDGGVALPGWIDTASTSFPEIWNMAMDSSSVSGAFNWNYDSSQVAWPDRDSELRVDVKAADAVGNYSVASSTFSFDSTSPISKITFPFEGARYPDMANISGTSFDQTSSINDVKIRLWYLSGGATYYWQADTPHWSASDPGWWSIAGSPGPKNVINTWSYTNADFTTPGVNFAWKEATHDGLNGKAFYVVTKAVDNTTNQETVLSTRTFVFDNEPPLSAPLLPGVDTSTKSLPTIFGTATDAVSTVQSVVLSVYKEESSKYFDGASFANNAETWLPASLFPSSWTYTNGLLAFADSTHYVIRSSATDNAGNVQSAVGQSRFLFDTTEPQSAVVNTVNGVVYEDSQLPGGNSSDPGFTSGIDGTGSGVYPALPWHQGSIEIAVFRDLSPFIVSGGPTPYGSWDASGYFWNGSTWTPSAGGVVWVPAQFTDTLGNWQYSGLSCDGDTERAAHTCWVRADPYFSWVRATDNAGNVEAVIDQGPKFYISAPAKSLLLTVSADPMTAGSDETLTIEARDGFTGAGYTAQAFQGTVNFYADGVPGGPEVMDNDAVTDDLHGLPQQYTFLPADYGIKNFTIRLRKASARTLRAEENSNPSISGTKNITVAPANADRVQVIADYDPLGQLPSPGRTEAGVEGSTGTPRTKVAGSALNYLLQVTDRYWNLVVSSAATVYVADTDPYGLFPEGYISFIGSTTLTMTFITADPSGWTVSATGHSGYPNQRNPSSLVPVMPGVAKRLLVLTPGESFNPGSATGKTGTPASQTAGTAFGVRVGVVDDYFNLVPARPADIKINTPTDAYAPAVTVLPVNVANGYTDLMYVIMQRAATHYLSASDFAASGLSDDPESSTFTVRAALPMGLQLVLPGETALPGSGNYPSGGKSFSASTQTAGANFNATVNLVDRYMNVCKDLSVGPTVYLVTSDIYDINPGSAPLNYGTLQVPLTLVTKSAASAVKAYPVDAADNKVCPENGDTICRNDDDAAKVSFKVYAAAAARLEVVFPGQTLAEGKCTINPPCAVSSLPWPGRSGPPSQYIIGAGGLNVGVYLTDVFFNRATDAVGPMQDTNPPALIPQVQAATPGDPYDVEPAVQSLAGGVAVFSLDPLTSAYEYSVMAATTAASPAGYQQGVSTLTAYSAPPGCWQIANVGKIVPAPFTSIQAAVDSLLPGLSTTTCVVIRDTETYSEQVTVKNLENNGYQLKILPDHTFVSSRPVVNPPLSSAAGFRIMNDSVTISGINVISTNSVSYGILASSSSINISSVNVVSGGYITTAGVFLSSRSVVSYSSVSVQDAHGLWLQGAFNSVINGNISNGASSKYALYGDAASSNTVSGSDLLNAAGTGLSLRSGSDHNDISRSTVTGNGTAHRGIELDGSSWNTVSYTRITSLSVGMMLAGGSNNSISQSTVANNSGSFPAFDFWGSNANTLTGDVISNQSGLGLHAESGANFNNIRQTRITANSGSYYALQFNASSSNTVTGSYISNSAGDAVRFISGANFNVISLSTVTTSAPSRFGASLNGVSYNTFLDSYIQGSDAAIYVNTSPGFVMRGCVVAGAADTSVGFNLTGSQNIIMATTTVSGGALAAAIQLNLTTPGTIDLSSNTITGGSYALNIGAQNAGAILSVTSMTISSVAAGGTAINFNFAGPLVSTFTGVAFNSGNIAVSVNAASLGAGSHLLMRNYSGAKAGPRFALDAMNYVEWSDTPGGVLVSTGVNQNESLNNRRSMVRSSNGDLYLIYQKSYSGNYRLFLARSADNGATWADTTAAPVDNSGCPATVGYAALAIDSKDVLHLAFNSSLPAGCTTGRLGVSSAAVPGTVWSPWQSIPGAYPYIGYQGQSQIAVARDDSVHLAWSDQDGGAPAGYGYGWVVKYSSRAATGQTWGNYTRLPGANGGTTAGMTQPALAIDGENVLHIVSRQCGSTYNPPYKIVYSSKSVYGGNWTGPLTVVDLTGTSRNQEAPSLAITSDNILLAAWAGQDDSNMVYYQIKFAAKPAAADSWGPWSNIDPIVQASQQYPSLAVDAVGDLHVVWTGTDTVSAVKNVKYSRYTGGTWSPWVNLTTGTYDQSYSVARWAGWRNNGGTLDAAWSADYAADHHLRYLRDPGVTMSAGFVDIVPPSAADYFYAYAVSSGSVNLDWTAPGNDRDGGTLDNSTFTIQHSANESVSWSTASAQVIISTSGVNPETARYYQLGGLAANTSHFFRLWTNDDSGNYSGLSTGATALTLIETPANVYADEVGTKTIVVSAYTPGGFTNLQKGLSGINHSIGGSFGAWVQFTSAAYNGLSPNMLYNFAVKARNQSGIETPASLTISTYTMAAVALSEAGNTFTAVFPSSVTVVWSSGTAADGYNGPGASYLVECSIDEAFAVPISSVTADVSASLSGLNSNTTYYFRAKAYNAGGMTDGSWLVLGSTVTNAIIPAAGAQDFGAVSAGGMDIYWGANGNADGTAYDFQLSTYSDFTYVDRTYYPVYASPVSVSALLANTTYYARVAAVSYSGIYTDYYVIGSTLTHSPAPESMLFTSVSTRTITAEAYSQYGFPNLAEGLSGISIAFGGGYSGWTQFVDAEYTGLTPNTSYNFKAKSRNQTGHETSESPEFSTYTLATVSLPQAGPLFSTVWLTSATVNWSSGTVAGGFNGPGASYYVEVSTSADYTPTRDAANGPDLWNTYYTLDPNTTFYYRVRATNSAGVANYDWLVLGSTSTLAKPVVSPFVSAVYPTTVTVNWAALPPSPLSDTCEGYLVQASTAPDFTGVVKFSVTAVPGAPQLTVFNLFAETTYYFRVGSLNHNGVPNYTLAGGTWTPTENIPPTIDNYESYDYAWYSAPSRSYNVDFHDTGGSALENFRIRATTGTLKTGTVTADWTDILTGMDVDDYTGDWTLTNEAWSLLQDGTNYVTVRVYDGSGNIDEEVDAFVVFKDTTPPSIAEGFDDSVWRSTYGFSGMLTFADPHSKLDGAEYSAWSAPGLSGTNLKFWTVLAAGAGLTEDNISMGVNEFVWDLLQSGTNYISLRAWDYSAPVNTNTWTDAFVILKDTVSPAAINALSVVSGSTYTARMAFSAPAEFPSGIEAFSVQYASYTAVWSTSAVLGSTHIYISTSGVSGGDGQAVGIEELGPNTTYYFAAWSLDRAGNWSAMSNVAAVPTLAEAPAFMGLPQVYTSSANVAWGNVAAAGFSVEASTAGDFTGVLYSSATADPAGISLYAEGLSPNTTYFMRAASLNWAGAANYSGFYEQSTYAVEPASAAVFAAVSSVSVTVEWLSNGNGPGTLYILDVSSDSFVNVQASSVTRTSGAGPYELTFEGLAPNTTYWFQARTQGNRGDSSAWLALGSTVTTPVPPVLTGYALWVTSAAVTWDSNGNGAGTLYQCDLSTSAVFAGLASSAYTATEFFLDLGGLAGNTTYYMRLRAVSAATGQASPYVNSAALTLAAAPGSISAWTIGSNNIGLYWDASQNPGVSGYAGWSGGTGLPAALYGHAAAVAGDMLFITGGYDGATYKSEVWYAPLSAAGVIGSWKQARSMPGARYAHSAAALKGRLYVIGGYDGTAPRAEVWSAPISSSGTLGDWVEEAPLPQAVYAHGFAAGSNAIYVIGGYNSGARDEVRYTKVNDDGTLAGWTAGPVLPQGAYSLAAAVGGGNAGPVLYAAGGYDGVSAKTAVWTAPINLDESVGAWTSAASLPSGIYGHALAGAPGALVISGGNGGSLATTNTILGRLNADGSIAGWTAGDALRAARQSHVMLARGSRLLTLGGYDGASAKADGSYASVTGTEYKLTATGAPFAETPWIAADSQDVGALTPNSYVTFRPSARNFNGVEAPGAVSFSTFTYAAQPSTAAITGVFISSMQANWLPGDNPAGTLYQAQLSSDAAHTLPAFSSATVNAYASFTDIDDDYTYYARVRAVNAAGIATAWTVLGSSTTRANPLLDFIQPVMTNNQAGDDNWRKSGTTLYDVDFNDAGGAYLYLLEVRASTSAGSAGTFNPDWTDVARNVNSPAYTADWALPDGFFDLLAPGTNYISVRAWDGNSNSTMTVDAFRVLKDTSMPVITDLQNGETDWRMDDAGPVYDVDFADAVSGLGGIEYSASPNQGSGDAAALAWTPIAALSTGPASYNADWGVDFAALANDATNYISVRVWDLAGNTVTVSGMDVFKILKFVSGPEVAITAPDTAYRSAVALITGTASDSRSHAMAGIELSFLDVSAAKYWNGADFLAPAPVWLAVSSAASWNYTPAITWADGLQYQVVARSSDVAGNYSVAYATRAFTFDSQEPVISYTSPAPGATVNSAASLNGTAFDLSGIAGMALMFQRDSDDKWWDFNTGTWTVTGSSASLAAGASWSFSMPELLKASLENGASYYYSVYADDNSVPQKNIGFGGYPASFGFVDDTAPAAIADLTASTGNVPGNISLTWSAPGDDGGTGMILYGQYKIQYSTVAGVVFSTADAQAGDTFTAVSAGSARAKELTSLVPGETYYLRAWTMDDAGNWGALSNGATAQAAPYPDRISGHVMKVSSEGITGVLVEAFDIFGALKASAFTVADGSGSYVLSPLPSGSYRVQATWTADDIISSVGTDSVALGVSNADFTLEITYELASIGGELIGYRLSPSAYKAQGAKPRSAVNVELYQHNRLIATAPVDASGKFLIKNLLPGKYILKVPDTNGGSKELSVSLKAGQALMINPLGELLKKEKVFAFPNPARKTVKFHIESDQSPLIKQVTVLDITGRVIKEFKDADFVLVSAGVWEASWNIPSRVASGVYIYTTRVKFEATGEHKKTIKKFAIVK